MDIKDSVAVDASGVPSHHPSSDKTEGPPLKCNKHGIVLVPQPSDDPEDPLVRHHVTKITSKEPKC